MLYWVIIDKAKHECQCTLLALKVGHLYNIYIMFKHEVVIVCNTGQVRITTAIVNYMAI